ncbi:MAG: hypothetical protein ABSD62_01025 [Candidatus Limnocylindrales bacterium]|jgi:hypothetical protein
MPGPLVAVAVGWIVLAPPIYDHSWPAIAFLIWTALVVLWLGSNPGDYVVVTGIVMLWFLGGAILAAIRLFVFLGDSLAPEPKEGAPPHRTTAGSAPPAAEVPLLPGLRSLRSTFQR